MKFHKSIDELWWFNSKLLPFASENFIQDGSEVLIG